MLMILGLAGMMANCNPRFRAWVEKFWPENREAGERR